MQFTRTSEEFRTILASTEMPEDARADITEKLSAYLRDFRTWVNAAGQVESDEKAAHEAYINFERILVAIEERSLRSAQVDLREG